MATQNPVTDLAAALLSGRVEVIDLTATLGPETPLIKLPPEIGLNTPAVEIHTISHYDDKGPFWAWNWLKLGEHSGTHFDAPQHWITGKDYPDGATDTIPVQNFVGPVNVIDCSAEVAKNGLPAHRRAHQGVGSQAWRDREGLLGRPAQRLVQAQWQREGLPERRPERSAFARPHGGSRAVPDRQGHHRLGLGNRGHGRWLRRRHDPALPRA